MPRLALPLLIALLLPACWAPEVAEPGPAVGAQPPDAQSALPPGAAPLAGSAALLPEPPFAARTRAAPLTLVGPGGVNLAQLATPGVEVEVLQVLPERVRVRCTGCPGDAAGVEGWLQLSAVEPVSSAEPQPGAVGG